MRISIIGAGWFGLPLGRLLRAAGHQVLGSTREKKNFLELEQAGIEPRALLAPDIPSRELLDADAIVLNIPPFPGQLAWFQSWPWREGDWPIFISSTSVYGNYPGVIHENTLRRPLTENGKILSDTEDWIRTLSPKGTIIRFGGLVGPTRHPGKHLAGKVGLSSGDSPVNLLHQDDATGFTKYVIEAQLTGEDFNLVSDEHATRREFYGDFAVRNGLPVPEFLSGGEQRIVDNQKVKRYYTLRWPRMIGRSL